MTKAEKIALLPKLMMQSKRNDGTEYYHFTDEAPRELTDLYLEHYEVRDIDYETFSAACDLVSECYNDNEQEDDGADFVREMIYERASDMASPYNADRLAYLNIWNQDEIAEMVRAHGSDIAEACAIWYDNQIEQAAILIHDWISDSEEDNEEIVVTD